ncbi:beta-phosphoglucomutase family hydrolase [Kineosphaera limosa]|uniref:Putative hydrolase n=1 Tax=Kineosphaera limosa NBRC 100340 TaxID=1184609 RepID=K6XFD7_9MICO|nr:beta-phosphoglucomutase family hydrolase [Kineosphaera limosa]GAB97559.1 putative hydrolase [Kineosphaera limosa NBRC 100340]
MDWTEYDAALFDLDGVLTPTAEVHMRAWERMFTDYLNSRDDAQAQQPYREADYFDHIDGKPRYDGVRTFLASRDIELPEGDPTDPTDQPPGQETVCGLGNRKNDAFNAVLAQEGVEPYPGSVALLDALPESVRLAVVSSSKNAPAVLKAAGLFERFPVIVDGQVAAAKGLPGKPAPDTFQNAADQLGVAHEKCVVLEDAHSGVKAGAAGGFGLVVGVDRGAGADALRASGAQVVVADLQELVP